MAERDDPLKPEWDDERTGRRRPRRERDDYDDDYDDRPRRRRGPPPAEKSNVVIWVVIGVVVGGFLLLGVAVALLLPAVQKVREAAARMNDMNNMKQIGLGMHNDAANSAGFHAPYAHDGNGAIKDGLSFRVSLLPYIEQDTLYRRFDLDQAWDSAHNRSSSNSVIKVYSTPFDKNADSSTPYRAFVGDGAMFDEDGRPIRVADITDGDGNTIMLIHAAESVPWAKPQELRYDPNGPLPAFGSLGSTKATHVLFADGSVKVLRHEVPEATIRKLITRAGGEQIGDW